MAKCIPPRGKFGTHTFCITSRQEQTRHTGEDASRQILTRHHNHHNAKVSRYSKLSGRNSNRRKTADSVSLASLGKRRKIQKTKLTIFYEDLHTVYCKVCVNNSTEGHESCRDCYITNYLRLSRLRIGVIQLKVCHYPTTSSISVVRDEVAPLPGDVQKRATNWRRKQQTVRVNHVDENNDIACISLSDHVNTASQTQLTSQQINDLTSLPPTSKYEPAPVKVPPNSVELVVFPNRRKQPRGGGQRSRQRQQQQTSQNAPEEEAPQPPIQVTENVMDMPNRENTVTSADPGLRRLGLPITTNLMSSVDSEDRLTSRRRGTNRNRAQAPIVRPPRYPEFVDRDKRQMSFTSWPESTMQSANNMAEQGFFFTGRQDLVRCFQCGIGMKDWSETDEPLFEHVRHSPECPFLLQHLGPELLAAYKVNLIPGGAQPASQRPGQPRSTQAPTQTTATTTAQQVMLGQSAQITTHSSSQNAPTATTTTTVNTGPESGNVNTGPASSNVNTGPASSNVRSPQYSTMEARVRSYNQEWPANISQTPQQLAEAGFFFSGYGDVCRCFMCDGGLQRWDPQDDPWIEHARWFPQCEYVRQTRGQDYIDLVQRAASGRNSSSEEESAVQTPPTASGAMAALSLNDNDALSTEAAKQVLDQGFSRKAVLLAIHELQAKGSRDLTSGGILEILRGKQERGEALPTDTPPNEAQGSPDPEQENDPNFLQQENERLRRKIKCIQCEEKDANMLFIPCTHHRMCEDCAENTQICPVCGRKIDRKVKTYMA